MMKRIVPILATLMFVAVGAQAQLVWPTEIKGIIFKKFGPKIEALKPPDGFTVTPADVSQMFEPRKYVIMIYADDTHYVITRYDRKQTYKSALLVGVTINGKTGAVEKRGLDWNLKVQKTYEEIKEKESSNQAAEATSEPSPARLP
jgi:hypothetical protein